MVWAEFVTISIIFFLPHQRNKAVEGMGGAILKGPGKTLV